MDNFISILMYSIRVDIMKQNLNISYSKDSSPCDIVKYTSSNGVLSNTPLNQDSMLKESPLFTTFLSVYILSSGNKYQFGSITMCYIEDLHSTATTFGSKSSSTSSNLLSMNINESNTKNQKKLFAIALDNVCMTIED